MATLSAIFSAALGAIGAWSFLVGAYLTLLTWAGLAGRAPHPPDGPGRRRFAILIPAHDEELLIAGVLRSLDELDYPAALLEVFVVADNCSDRTAAIARELGATVLERSDTTKVGKGFALEWALVLIRSGPTRFDAFVVLDADSTVAPNFLRRMEGWLDAGSLAVQAYYTVRNADESELAALRFAALASLHYLRPRGRSVLGLSCGLKGNGMCFAAPVLERRGWGAFTLAEDVELHLALVGEGVRVDFAANASVLADMPSTFGGATSQNLRWERGRIDMLRRRVPGLIAHGLKERSALQLDAAAEQLIPPLSVGVAISAAGALLAAASGATAVSALAAFGLLAQLGHVVAGLAAIRAPARVYRSLALAPAYIGWKLVLYGRAAVAGRSGPWIRTARGASAEVASERRRV